MWYFFCGSTQSQDKQAPTGHGSDWSNSKLMCSFWLWRSIFNSWPLVGPLKVPPDVPLAAPIEALPNFSFKEGVIYLPGEDAKGLT